MMVHFEKMKPAYFLNVVSFLGPVFKTISFVQTACNPAAVRGLGLSRSEENYSQEEGSFSGQIVQKTTEKFCSSGPLLFTQIVLQTKEN